MGRKKWGEREQDLVLLTPGKGTHLDDLSGKVFQDFRVWLPANRQREVSTPQKLKEEENGKGEERGRPGNGGKGRGGRFHMHMRGVMTVNGEMLIPTEKGWDSMSPSAQTQTL